MTKRTAAFAVSMALAAGLAACTTATPYQPNIPGQATSGGYSEIRVEPDRWRVSFQGNTLTSRETVEAYLLFRSAELTVQQGYDWFEMVDRHTSADLSNDDSQDESNDTALAEDGDSTGALHD